MKNLFGKLAALTLTAVTLLAGCGDYEEAIERPQEVTYSTLQVYTEPETTAHTTEASTSAAATAKQTTAATTTAKQTSKPAKTTAKTTKKAEKTTAVRTAEPTTVTTANADYVEYRFRNKKYLDQHFEKHGAEFADDFGYKTAQEYEQGASDVINNEEALHKTEKDDGDYVYYIEATNEFVVLSKDGYIRTYFRPDSGKKYYDKQ